MSKVTVAKHPETNQVITASTKNKEWGTIRLESETVSIVNNMLTKRKRSAFINGKLTDLKAMNFKEGDILPGIIQKQESFNPFYETQSPKTNPTTGEVVLTDGKETYINFLYVADSSQPIDVWISNETEEVVNETEDQNL